MPLILAAGSVTTAYSMDQKPKATTILKIFFAYSFLTLMSRFKKIAPLIITNTGTANLVKLSNRFVTH